MGEKTDMKILFSCVGTSDPVRGCRDGSMLHIARKYRPDKVILLITKEMRGYEENDNRYEKALKSIGKYTDGYEPILEKIYNDVEDVSDFDAFDAEFERIIREINEKNPDAEILLNLSSGTVQMKMAMAFLAADIRFKCRGIQVKNPEKQSGKAERTNSPKYEVDVELECNEDNEADAPNRCEEPELFIVKRKEGRERIRVLLESYDYKALSESRKLLPEKCRPLVQHLYDRSTYECKKAEILADRIQIPFNLYPAYEVKSRAENEEYRKISEYVLCLKLMQKRGELTHFVLRLNPLILNLQLRYLKKECGLDIRDITEGTRTRPKVSYQKIHDYSEDLEEYLNTHLSNGIRDDSDISILFCNVLIEFFEKQDTDNGKLLYDLEQLNAKQRNTLAHTLCNVDEKAINDSAGIRSELIVKKIERMVQDLYPECCKPELFDIYERCNDYILKML